MIERQLALAYSTAPSGSHTGSAGQDGHRNALPVAYECAPLPGLKRNAQLVSLSDETTANPINLPEAVANNIKNSFKGFLNNVSTIGISETCRRQPSIAAGLICGLGSLVPGVGQLAHTVMAASVHDACAAFASFIGPDSGQIARTVFSGITLFSATIRSVFPLVKEALATTSDPTVKCVIAVSSFALAACHFAISAISTLIATNNAPGMSNKEVVALPAGSASTPESAVQSFLNKLANWVSELREQSVMGVVGTAREWLLLSSAAVGLLAVMPLVFKSVGVIVSAPIAAIVGGSVNLCASVLELVQGIVEHGKLDRELQTLLGKATEANTAALELDIEQKKLALALAKGRIAKGVFGILMSAASITLGVLALAASITVPFVPAIITSISILGVAVYVAFAIALKTKRLQDAEKLKLQQDSPASPGEPESPEQGKRSMQEPVKLVVPEPVQLTLSDRLPGVTDCEKPAPVKCGTANPQYV